MALKESKIDEIKPKLKGSQNAKDRKNCWEDPNKISRLDLIQAL